MLSVRELTEQMSLTEFVRIAAAVDDYVEEPNTRFNTLKLVRDGKGLAVWVDCGKSKMFWVVLGEKETTVQTKVWDRVA